MDTFEPTRLGQCDECDHLHPINEHGLCQHCDAAAEAFSNAAAAAIARGHDPFKAGMIAAKRIAEDKARTTGELYLDALNKNTIGIVDISNID